MRILMVCMGNICRSPIAEGLLRDRLRRRGLGQRVQVDSAGTGGWHAGQPPDPRAVQVCREQGIAIDDLRARQVLREDFALFDWMLCADLGNLRHLRGMVEAPPRATVGLLLQKAGLGEKAEVPDPYYGSLDDFREVYRLLDRAVDGLFRGLGLPA